MDKLADNLQKLGEDDLLRVVQMVHDNKTPETYTKNDVERKSDSGRLVVYGLMRLQRANFTSIYTLCPTAWSGCCGISRRNGWGRSR